MGSSSSSSTCSASSGGYSWMSSAQKRLALGQCRYTILLASVCSVSTLVGAFFTFHAFSRLSFAPDILDVSSAHADVGTEVAGAGRGGASSPAAAPIERLLGQPPWKNDDVSLVKAALSVDEEPDHGTGSSPPNLGPQETHVSPKLAFLFLTRGPLPLAPLWGEFFHEAVLMNESAAGPLFSIYVHTAKNFSYDEEDLPDMFRGRNIRSEDIKWGSFAMIEAERRLVANALLDKANTRFILVSESCIPLFSFSFIYRRLIHSSHSGHVEVTLPPPGRSGLDRWTPNLLPLVPKEDWRKGSQWFEMGRVLARAFLSDTIFYPVFRRYCVRSTCLPDEHYLPTILHLGLGAPEKAVLLSHLVNQTLTNVDWGAAGTDLHPKVYISARVNLTLIRRLRGPPVCSRSGPEQGGDGEGQCFFFARKFAPDTLQKLLGLRYLDNGKQI